MLLKVSSLVMTRKTAQLLSYICIVTELQCLETCGQQQVLQDGYTMFFRYIMVPYCTLKDVWARQTKAEMLNRLWKCNNEPVYKEKPYIFLLWHDYLKWIQINTNNCHNGPDRELIMESRHSSFIFVPISFIIVSVHYRRSYHCAMWRKQCSAYVLQECYNIPLCTLKCSQDIETFGLVYRYKSTWTHRVQVLALILWV